jgi:hypothetical protein
VDLQIYHFSNRDRLKARHIEDNIDLPYAYLPWDLQRRNIRYMTDVNQDKCQVDSKIG